MRPILAIAAFALIALSACKKNEYGNNNPNTPTNPNALVYSINGVSDVKIPTNGGKEELVLAIAMTSGTQEAVTLSLSGVPAKVKAEFSTTSGTPTFTSTLSITSDDAAQGTYPLTLTGTTASGAKKTVNFNLVIDKPEDCATPMAGSYHGTRTCNGSSTPDPTAFMAQVDASKMNTLLLTAGVLGPNPVPAVLDCGKGTVTLTETNSVVGSGPNSQTIKVTGSGTFNAELHKMDITVVLVITYSGQQPNTTTCTYSMVK
jgi:hypothetical protein